MSTFLKTACDALLVGGAWVTGSMIMGGMGFGTNGGMMGPGWAHPNGGTYGMTFSFTTSS